MRTNFTLIRTRRKALLTVFLLVLSCSSAVLGQQPVASRNAKTDSLVKALSAQIQTIGRDGVSKSNEKYRIGKNIAHQRELIGNLKKMSAQLKVFLREGIDTLGLSVTLSQIRSSIELAKDGIITNKGSAQSQRNLTVSAAILNELTEQITHLKTIVDNYAFKLLQFQSRSDSLLSDTALFSFIPDSAGIAAYAKRLIVVAKEISPADTLLARAITSVEELQYRIDLIHFELAGLQEDVDQYSKTLSAKAFTKEFPYLFADALHFRPFDEIVHYSAVKEWMVLWYYAADNVFVIVVLIVLILLSYYFIHSLKKQIAAEDNLVPGDDGQLILRRPFLAAVFIVLTIFQFLFPQPPYIFNAILWLISAICLCLIFHGYISSFWIRFWIAIIVFFILASLLNLLLQISRIERIMHLVLSLAGMIYAGYILYRGYHRDRKEKSIIYFIAFLFICEAVAVVLNIAGRVNMAKTFLVAGFAGMLIAILFLWVFRLVNEGIVLAFNSYKKPERRSFFINFNRVGSDVPPFLYLFLVAGWFFLVGRNFYGFNKFYRPITTFLTEERKVGDYSFTLIGCLLFFFILASSVFISKLVSFFATEPGLGHQADGTKKKMSTGSWILLLRIVIISLGLYLSFAASGIPMDRITIVLGALGVGIGLGLQELFNNLVSGIVLSFERPVNVGDLIEMDGKMGTMKSIGFRSSIITSSEGASIIIPNGELLSHRLINWSLNNHYKQSSILLSVAMSSDLEQVKTLLWDIVRQDDRILDYPAANIIFKELLHGTVDLEIVYWPKHISASRQVRSDLISTIKTVFNREGIIIPIPQEELFIRSFPEQEGRNKKQSDSGN